MSPECQALVNKAADYICKMAAHLSTDDIRGLLQAPGPREAERLVDEAALSGNPLATKTACRAWWEAWRTTIAHHGKDAA